MRQFSISKDSLVWEFLKEMNIDFESAVTSVLRKKFPNYTKSQVEEFLAEHWDDITQPIEEYRGTLYDSIDFLSSEDEEVEESSGTWGYAIFSIEDEEKTKKEILETLEWEIEASIDQVMELIDSAQPKCPYCGTRDWNCDHLFALYDETFNSMDGGYIYGRSEFDNLLSEFILDQLAKNDPASLEIDFEYAPLQDLWEEIIEEERCVFDEETKQWELDLPNLNSLILELLDDLIEPEYGEFEGGPGQSSAYRIYYARDTQVAFNDLLENWKAILKVSPDLSK